MNNPAESGSPGNCQNMERPEFPENNNSIPSSGIRKSGIPPESKTGKSGKVSKRDPDITGTRVLLELERLRIELLNSISSELRTPLASIKESATILLQPDLQCSDNERRKLLEFIEQETDRLRRIVTGTLDMAHLEKGTIKLEKSGCRISDLFYGLADRLHDFTRHHYLRLFITRELPVVFLDRGK
jgi:two-component system sensor histidine kinase KdpD